MEEPVLVNIATVPPAPVLFKAVTMELPLIFCVPPAGMVYPALIKVKLPVVFVVMLVRVLLLMFTDKCAAAFDIAVMATLLAIEAVNEVKLLLLMV
jgi:hypothetical protein